MASRPQQHASGVRASSHTLPIVPHAGPILIIDDDPEVRDVMSGVIEAAGYDVITASDGEEGLARIEEQHPSLIFLDIEMPVMNGLEFRQHQRHDPDLIRIPTIVMTGSDIEPMLDLAVEETLRKPARLRDILDLVRQYCIPASAQV